MMPSLGVIIHPFQLPAGWNLTGPNNFTWNNNYSKAEYTNTQQDLPDKSYPRHVGFWLVGLFCWKETRIMDPYFQYFSLDSSEITITTMSN
jgi:hypothetical protein